MIKNELMLQIPERKKKKERCEVEKYVESDFLEDVWRLFENDQISLINPQKSEKKTIFSEKIEEKTDLKEKKKTKKSPKNENKNWKSTEKDPKKEDQIEGIKQTKRSPKKSPENEDVQTEKNSENPRKDTKKIEKDSVEIPSKNDNSDKRNDLKNPSDTPKISPPPERFQKLDLVPKIGRMVLVGKDPDLELSEEGVK